MCQKAGGGPFMAFAGVPLTDVNWTRGKPAIFRSSNLAARGFCPVCGTPLTFQSQPDRISFTTGSFDDPSAIVPVEQLGRESLLAWSEHVATIRVVPTPEVGATFVNHQHPDHDT